jgi:hypothetical protein
LTVDSYDFSQVFRENWGLGCDREEELMDITDQCFSKPDSNISVTVSPNFYTCAWFLVRSYSKPEVIMRERPYMADQVVSVRSMTSALR